MIVLVADDGLGPHHPPVRPGAGRGWSLIAHHTDGFTVSQRASGGTLIEMRWALGATAALEPADAPPAA